ncbi:HAD-IIB family hydrolase [Streptomyces sp. NPDC005395]|uniref:HAD-IIB family hydrolase n=1 Tax=unclassified Streptomyces TaxID=2593676 RepID=UPI0033A1F663
MHIITFSFECGGFDPRLMRGGLSPLVWQLSRRYAAQGHRVSLVTPGHGHVDRLRAAHGIEDLPHLTRTRTVPLALDPEVWASWPADLDVDVTTTVHRLRLDGVDVYFLSNAYLDLLPDRLYPPPGVEGRDLSHFKPLVFQAEGLRFVQEYLRSEDEPAVVHAFEPAYHYLLPPVLAPDPFLHTVSTVAANAPIGQKVYRPQVTRMLKLFGVADVDLDALDGPPPEERSTRAVLSRALAGTRMHVEYGPDHVGLFPLIAAHADLVDFVSPGQRAYYSTFRDTPVQALFETLPVARTLRQRADRVITGGCAVTDSWLARDTASVDRHQVLRRLGIDPALPVFYHAARYAVHHKGQLELMRAIEELLDDGVEAGFLLRCSTGDGAAANAYFQSVADRHPDRLRIAWDLADEDTLFEEAACADFCVYPSKFELDGFLIAQAEAMACGAVPIATDQHVTRHFRHALPSGHPEATGFSVPGSFHDDDPALARGLAARIRTAVGVFAAHVDGSDPTYARLSANSRALARRFTWERAARTRLDAFEGLLHGRVRPFPVREAIAYGWFDDLPASAWDQHPEEIREAALTRGDLGAWERAGGAVDAQACERLFEAAWREAEFTTALHNAVVAGRSDLTARVHGRGTVRRTANGRWEVTYRHEHVARVEAVLEGRRGARTGPDAVSGGSRPAAGETAAEALASDEPVPPGTGAVFHALSPQGGRPGSFRAVLDAAPAGRDLSVMLTLASGHVRWDTLPLRRPPFRLVATDLDGTLLRDDLTVSPRTRAALAAVTDAGAHHLVATGRPASACAHILDALGYRGLAVCGQGAQLYDAGSRRLLSSASLGRTLARRVVAGVEERLGPVELGVVTAPPDSRFKVTEGFGQRVRHGWDVTTDRDLLWDSPVDKLILHHPEVDEDRLAALTQSLFGDEVTVVHSVKGMVEVLPPGTTKAAGVERAARLLGCAASDTIAFGDMPNDVPLLTWAAHGVAVANAHPALLTAADEIAPPNEEDGVAVVLERLFTPGAQNRRTPSERHA